MYARYDQTRHLSNKAFRSSCYAPFVTLLLDPRGMVRACCQSMTHSLGSITERRLSEIWRGPAIESLRRQLVDYELPGGCATCKWQIEQRNYDLAFSRHYDHFPVASMHPEWPQSIDFFLSNRCNLECVQCFGELSSSIRDHRENLPPLPPVYGEEFFQDLRSFLPHLAYANFLGGEPFLSEENYRVWEMMIEDGLSPTCTIVTNGTVFGKRVERLLDRLACGLSISLDGATPETVESIRRNARFDSVLRNVERFLEYTRARGTHFSLSYCLMPQNHQELPLFLELAEKLDCAVSVHIVNHPPRYSLSSLPRSELRSVVESWERRDAEVRSRLHRHRPVWERQLARLRNQLEHDLTEPERFFLTSISPRLRGGPDGEAPTPGFGRSLTGLVKALWRKDGPTADSARTLLARWSRGSPVDEMRLDPVDTVTSSSEGFAGLTREEVLGRSMTDVLMRLRERYGPDADVSREEIGPRHLDRVVDFVDASGRRTSVRWIAVAEEGGGREVIVRAAVRSEESSTRAQRKRIESRSESRAGGASRP